MPSSAICRYLPALVAALVALSGPAFAQGPALSHLQYSADIGANLVAPGQFAARRDYVDDDLSGTRQRIQIGVLSDNVILRDFHIETNGDLLFAVNTGFTFAGKHFVPGDVIRHSGGILSVEFSATGAGVPDGVHVDGVARLGRNGPLLLSFDRTFSVGALTIRPADVIATSAGVFGAKVLDARALGLPATLDVDAIDSMGTTTDLLVSFKTAGTVGGVRFADEDVLQLHLADGSWSKRFVMLDFSDRWGAANLDGLASTNTDTILQNGFE